MTEAAWQPPMDGTAADLAVVLADPRREEANAEALRRMTAAGADLVDVRPAHEALGIEKGTFLHAGPPITWDRASGPLKGALIGAMLFEGLADTAEEAEAKLAKGDGITLEPCHHHDAVGPMAGVISPVDVALRAARRGARRHVLVLPQRGTRQGAALRRLRPRGDRPAALDELGARPAAAAGRAQGRPDRRQVDRRPDAADGRRGPQPQPRRQPDAAARAAARR